MKVSFSLVDLVVSDVRESVEFYRQLGMEIPSEAVWEEGEEAHHVEVPGKGTTALGMNTVSLTRRYNANWSGSTGAVLIFQVPTRDDVDAKYAELTGAGFVSHMPPIDAFWGSRYAIVDDPDGNHVGIMSARNETRSDTPSL
jgi:uncharacterized glyoxalase superfamily protein PhnB